MKVRTYGKIDHFSVNRAKVLRSHAIVVLAAFCYGPDWGTFDR